MGSCHCDYSHYCKGVEGLRKVVVYGATRNLYDAMKISANSLLLNNAVDKVYLLTEDDKPFHVPRNVKIINVSNQTYFDRNNVNCKKRWTYMSLMRCALPKLLNESVVLWLDCDTITDDDISDLFNTDLTGCYFAGVKEPQNCSANYTYINAGVLLMNLDEMRKDKFDDALINLLNTRPMMLPDQDAINTLGQGKIKPISGKYNCCAWTEQADEKKIIHYAANAYFMTEKKFKEYAKKEGKIK